MVRLRLKIEDFNRLYDELLKSTSEERKSMFKLYGAKLIEVGEGDFWSQIHKPFKKNIITKGTVKDLIQTARNRYQANLPGLAVKLGACSRHYQSNSDELKKFTSFKNFLYKTVKISESN